MLPSSLFCFKRPLAIVIGMSQPPDHNPQLPEDDASNPFAPPVQSSVKSEEPNEHVEGASALDGILPTNPLAAVSCYTGIFGLITCFLGIILGPIAIVLGILALKTWKVQESQYGKTMSSVRAWIGIVTGILGIILGSIAIVLAITSANQ